MRKSAPSGTNFGGLPGKLNGAWRRGCQFHCINPCRGDYNTSRALMERYSTRRKRRRGIVEHLSLNETPTSGIAGFVYDDGMHRCGCWRVGSCRGERQVFPLDVIAHGNHHVVGPHPKWRLASATQYGNRRRRNPQLTFPARPSVGPQTACHWFATPGLDNLLESVNGGQLWSIGDGCREKCGAYRTGPGTVPGEKPVRHRGLNHSSDHRGAPQGRFDARHPLVV
ncbi:MAG: hypothetical protein ACI9W2_003492 [Gammaproteobacteria bacterium]|jgi:hypothetical protein